MKNECIDSLADRVMERLFGHVIEIEASGRHVHLSRDAVERLFGRGYQLTKKAELSQPGQFVCRERVSLRGAKGTLDGVAVLGPERAETQVELSATDALALGVKAPVRMSGQLEGTPGITLIGPRGELSLPRGVLIAKRHVHLTPEDARRFGVKNGEEVEVSVLGERALVFRSVAVRVSPDFASYMHIDYDEANACGFRRGMAGILRISGEGSSDD